MGPYLGKSAINKHVCNSILPLAGVRFIIMIAAKGSSIWNEWVMYVINDDRSMTVSVMTINICYNHLFLTTILNVFLESGFNLTPNNHFCNDMLIFMRIKKGEKPNEICKYLEFIFYIFFTLVDSWVNEYYKFLLNLTCLH